VPITKRSNSGPETEKAEVRRKKAELACWTFN